MAEWQRRSVLTTGAAILTGGLLTSVGAADRTTGENQAALEEPSGWSSHGGTAGNTRLVPSEDGLEEPAAVAWRYDESGPVAVVDGRVYLRTDGGVHALDADDGSVLWTVTDIEADRTPTVADGTVYVTGDQLTAIDTDEGKVSWSQPFGDGARSSEPVVVSEIVYVAVDGTLYAFDAADGSCRWKHDSVDVAYEQLHGENSDRTSYVFSTQCNSIAVTDGTIWAVLDDRRSDESVGMDAMAAFDRTTGEVQWSAPLEGGDYARGLAATEDALFIESEVEEGVMVFDRSTSENGDFIPDALVTATVNGRAVTRGRYELAMHSSDTVWSENGTHRYGLPTIVGNTVVVAHSVNGPDTPDEILGLDLETGAEQWRFVFDEARWSDGFNIECVVADGTTYVTRNDSLAALR
jgi:outer membrane protein assembly factor BamB